MTDAARKSPEDREHIFLSRALTAMTLQDLTGCDADEAAAGVIDADADNGIDGIAVDLGQRKLWLVQAKWSDKGRAGLGQNPVGSISRGVKLIQDSEFNEFNDRFQKHASAVEEVMSTPGVKIVMVFALLGKPPLADAVNRDLGRILNELNDLEPIAEHRHYWFSDFYQIVRDGSSSARADLTVSLQDYGHIDEPYRAYYGVVPVADVANWYADSGDRLFDQNIRRSLGLTEVNNQLRSTLQETPSHFWYFNNGITVLCESLQKLPQGSTRKIGTFIATGANVVNGAQTVKSIYETASSNGDSLDEGYVWVRLISLENCPPGFADDVTTATNTQNQVVARDFVALDGRQRELRTDFALSLNKTYVIQRGEDAPSEESGCTVEEATRALACAQDDPSFAARARASGPVLWERGPKGTYESIFARKPGALRVWRCIQMFRAVQAGLQMEKDEREGRAAKVAECADALAAHIVLHRVGLENVDDPTRNWDAELEQASSLTSIVLDWLTYYVDELYGTTSFVPATFRDESRCTELARSVSAALDSGGPIPELPAAYRPSPAQARGRRAVRAVIVLVNAGHIADGTVLNFQPQGIPEKQALEAWLAGDPQRGRATWVNNRAKPLLWAADGKRYSPSGLVNEMLRQAGHKGKPVQGTSRWFIADQGSLVDIANRLREDEE
ncbi:AIPR family protein [Qaidamihabitans albus]|uniref:AIPR family protein n=1 Tax=Qaidamihabitans albus TaxID=2795733 RepID=UPI0018F18773|nr:AIPR family protein [Qaidamihabitans albus]